MCSLKTLGILGGMGPYATSLFFKKVLDLIPAKKEWEYPRIIIDNNTQIPSRSRFYLYGEASPVPGMIESCKRLESYPVDFIVIPCNSASFFLNQVQEQVGIPILNIFEITVNAMKKKLLPGASVAVLGGVLTIKQKVYLAYVQKAGYNYIHIDESIQKDVARLIEEIKLNEDSDAGNMLFNSIIERLQRNCRVDAVILGCTELGFMGKEESSILFVDSLHELALQTVMAAGVHKVKLI